MKFAQSEFIVIDNAYFDIGDVVKHIEHTEKNLAPYKEYIPPEVYKDAITPMGRGPFLLPKNFMPPPKFENNYDMSDYLIWHIILWMDKILLPKVDHETRSNQQTDVHQSKFFSDIQKLFSCVLSDKAKRNILSEGRRKPTFVYRLGI